MLDLFLNNKYTKWYFNIIETAKQEKRTKGKIYYEKHHIVPKSLGGQLEKNNEILLTAKEHYICHLLLIKMVKTNKHKTKMAFALHGMRKSNSKGNKRYYSKLYESIRIHFSHLTSGKNNPFYGKGHFGKNNHFYGKTHTKKTKAKIKEALSGLMIGEKNPFYGKKHSAKTKKILKQIRSHKIKVIFYDESEVILNCKKDLGRYLGYSNELGLKLNNPKYKHLWKKYNIKDIINENTDNQINN